MGVYDVPCKDPNGNWITRCDNLVNWIEGNKYPDIIAIQEAFGWVWCPTNFDLLTDYEELFYMISKLNMNPNVNYRIAYLTGVDAKGRGDCGIGGGVLGGCDLYSGKAVIYNSNRLSNLTSNDSDLSVDHTYNYGNSTSPIFRRSLPACNVKPVYSNLISQIDGPGQNDKCLSKPSGKVWVMGGAAFIRLKLLFTGDNPENEVHIYNVHFHESDYANKSYNEFIDSMEKKFPLNRIYPPLIMGDFNLDLDTEANITFPNFDLKAYGLDDNVIGILVGKKAIFSSHYDFNTEHIEISSNPSECPNPNGKTITDHCSSLFFSISPIFH